MYPSRDFYSLLSQPSISSDILITSISREPFPELLEYWNSLSKPQHLFDIFSKGITLAISNNRYPLYQLLPNNYYPEFHTSILLGLQFLWLNLRFSIQSSSLYIDYSIGDTLNISHHDKLFVLHTVSNNLNSSFNIYLSNHADQIQQLICRLQSFVSR